MTREAPGALLGSRGRAVHACMAASRDETLRARLVGKIFGFRYRSIFICIW